MKDIRELLDAIIQDAEESVLNDIEGDYRTADKVIYDFTKRQTSTRQANRALILNTWNEADGKITGMHWSLMSVIGQLAPVALEREISEEYHSILLKKVNDMVEFNTKKRDELNDKYGVWI